MECLLSFGLESFVFQFVIQKFKDEYIQNYNLASYFIKFIIFVKIGC